MQRFDREQLWTDAFVGAWFVLGGVVGHAVYQGWVRVLPVVGCSSCCNDCVLTTSFTT